MIRQVFNAFNEEIRKGDFVHQVEKDCIELKIIITYDKTHYENYVKEAAFSYLVKENETKDKTKPIKVNQLEMSNYLRNNKSLVLSKILFVVCDTGTKSLEPFEVQQ